MIAFEIKLNGKKHISTGIEDWNLIHANITARRMMDIDSSDIYDLSLSGLPEQKEQGKLEHVRWRKTNLNLNDEITIKIIETDDVDPPLKRYRSDREIQENPFTDEEIFEMQKSEYLMLKEKFKDEEFI